MAGSVRGELWTWKGINGRRKYADIIPITVFGTVWKERNIKAFEGWMSRMVLF